MTTTKTDTTRLQVCSALNSLLITVVVLWTGTFLQSRWYIPTVSVHFMNFIFQLHQLCTHHLGPVFSSTLYSISKMCAHLYTAYYYIQKTDIKRIVLKNLLFTTLDTLFTCLEKIEYIIIHAYKHQHFLRKCLETLFVTSACSKPSIYVDEHTCIKSQKLSQVKTLNRLII